MDRFRPNVIVTSCDAFAEDTWPRIRMGVLHARAGGPCGRWIMTTTDEQTAERGKEPLRTLAEFRREPADPTGANFGPNFIREIAAGTLTVGAPVDVVLS